MNIRHFRHLLCLSTVLLAACHRGGRGAPPMATPNDNATVRGRFSLPAAAALAPAAAAANEPFDATRPMAPGEVVAWLEPGTDANTVTGPGLRLLRAGGQVAVFHAIDATTKPSLRQGAALAESCEQATVDAATRLQAYSGVRCASPNWLMQPFSEPNDPLRPLQWHYDQIHLPAAWNLTQGSANVIVAVLDTGIVAAHPDVDTGRFVSGYDMISNPTMAGDGDGRDSNPEDVGDNPPQSSFHGTHVAGTIGAKTNNGLGVAGVDWHCKLMIVRVLGRGGGTVSDIADGILYAARLPNSSGQLPAQRADIVNMSLGGPGISTVLQQACDAAAAADVLLVAAAGNENSTQPHSPAAFDSVLAVGAVDFQRARAPYSNYGTTVDIWAPGGDMSVDLNLDNYPDGVLSSRANDLGQPFSDFQQGTSMASPHVAGVAALVKARNATLTANQIRAILTTSTNTQAGLNLPNGGRLVDAGLAVQAAGAGSQSPALAATPVTIDFGTATGTASIETTNAGGGFLVLSSVIATPPTPWLSTQGTDATPGNGLDVDHFELTVDRALLAPGTQEATLTLTYQTTPQGGGIAGPIAVDVALRVSRKSPPANESIYVMLVDPNTLETRFQVTSSSTAREFAFTNIPKGRYLLVAGTDRDDDNALGDAGEWFGAWPSLEDIQPLTIESGVDRTDLDFALQAMLAQSSQSASPTWEVRRQPRASPSF